MRTIKGLIVFSIKALFIFGLSIAISLLQPQAVYADCGCSNMRFAHTGTTRIMCSNADFSSEFSECTQSHGSSQGCLTTYAYQCPLGVNSQNYSINEPEQKTGFQSIATLTSGSAIGECKTGQILQMTIKSGDNLENTELNPQINPTSVKQLPTTPPQFITIDDNSTHQFPQVTALYYGGDNYRNYKNQDVLFNYDSTNSKLSWWDNTDQTKDSQAERAQWHYKFISFVLGSGSTPQSCQCAFDVTVDWQANSNNPTTNYINDTTPGLSKNCTWP